MKNNEKNYDVDRYCFLCLSSIRAGRVNLETPHPSSILTVAPTNQKGQYKGSLLSPMTTRQINSIPNPAKGLMVYDTDVKCLKVNKGTPAIAQWVCIRTK